MYFNWLKYPKIDFPHPWKNGLEKILAFAIAEHICASSHVAFASSSVTTMVDYENTLNLDMESVWESWKGFAMVLT